MSLTSAASASFEARVEGFPTGLAGTVGVQLLDNVGGVTTARVTAGIIENPAGSGSYAATLTAPSTPGAYTVFWDTGTVSPSTTASEDLVVSGSAGLSVTPNLRFEARVSGFPSGLAGTVGVRVLDNVGGTTTARTTAGVIEDPAGSGSYAVALTAPSVQGAYTVFWDTGTVSPTTTAASDLTVAYTAYTPVGPSSSDLCTLADVRLALKLQDSETQRDAEIAAFIPDVSKAIRDFTEREFAPAVTAATRRFLVTNTRVNLTPYDLRTASAVVLNPETSSPTTLAVTTGYMLRPVQPLFGVYDAIDISIYSFYGLYTATADAFGYGLMDVTGDWGFATVPGDVKRAAIVTVMSWLDRPVNAYAATDFDQGGRALLADSAAGMSIPYAARRLLGPYRRMVVV